MLYRKGKPLPSHHMLRKVQPIGLKEKIRNKKVNVYHFLNYVGSPKFHLCQPKHLQFHFNSVLDMFIPILKLMC